MSFLRSTLLSLSSHSAVRPIVLVSGALGLTLACTSTTSSGFGNEDGGTGGTSGVSSGFTGTGSDSGPCNPNPNNFEVPGNNCDDDGDGKVDNVDACDTGLAATGSADDFAKALGICKKASGDGWGLVSASFTRGYQDNAAPNAGQHGILPKFGNTLKPTEGGMLGVLSSGFAREYNAASGQMPFNRGSDEFAPIGQIMQGDAFQPEAGVVPPGFPKNAGGCPSLAKEVYDVSVVKLVLKAPTNAKGVAFDFNFFTSEWPKYLCTSYNDSFIAYLKSKKSAGGADNVSFDSKKNPVSVNMGFFDRCTPNVQTGCCSAQEAAAGVCETGHQAQSTCPGGPGELSGTGYGVTGNSGGSDEDKQTYCKDTSTGGGSTGWLTTQAPIEPGEEITMEFYIWDTGDPLLDSSVLLDNFRWIPGDVEASTARPK